MARFREAIQAIYNIYNCSVCDLAISCLNKTKFIAKAVSSASWTFDFQQLGKCSRKIHGFTRWAPQFCWFVPSITRKVIPQHSHPYTPQLTVVNHS